MLTINLKPNRMRWRAERTHCAKGHEYTPENTHVFKGWRKCRTCARERKLNSERARGVGTREQRAARDRKHRQVGMQFSRPKGESSRLQKRRHISRMRTLVNELKNAPCADCGGRFHHCAMDFDHVDAATKASGISELVANGKSKPRILEEIAKCDLVCSNCHRLRTFVRLHGEASAVPGPG